MSWNAEKVRVFRDEFTRFINHVKIHSKEKGEMILGQHIYAAQNRLLDEIFSGLTNDIHDFKVGKSRQLGISTLSRALTLFWMGVHKGLNGYMVFDTSQNLEKARIELSMMLRYLPASLNFPTVTRENRTLMELSNGSIVNFASAGVRETKNSGGLGRSSGINFVHASEMCSWQSTEGVEAFINALAQDYENRLYLWESTARGFNMWHDMWQLAKADPEHQKTIFISWYHKDNQIIRRDSPEFERYNAPPLTDKELEQISEIKRLYGHVITEEQWAWYRRKMHPTPDMASAMQLDWQGNPLRIQEHPHTEEEMFQQTGASFFEVEDLTKISKKTVEAKYKPYSYAIGLTFADTRIIPSPHVKSTELKVWREPEKGGVYIVAADVAFGANPKNDRSSIQVGRCYADCVEQVAEYAWPLIRTEQFAYVIASLLGWYGRDDNEVYLILEYNGPGEAVWSSLTKLKNELTFLKYMRDQNQTGLLDIFRNVHNYIYGRSDSLSPSRNLHWKTSPTTKVPLLEAYRDYVSNGRYIIRSADLVSEMKTVTRDGVVIEATGRNKDDRVLASAMLIRCWLDRVQRKMMGEKRTKANEDAARRLTIADQVQLFTTAKFEGFFAGKQRERELQIAIARRRSWRGR